MPMGLVIALVVGLVVLLVGLLVALVVALRSTTSVVDRLGTRLEALEDDAAQLRALLGDVDDDLGRVADALSGTRDDPSARDDHATRAGDPVPEARHG